jgi:uncharacterized protein
MRFTRDAASAINIIRAYGRGDLRINDTVYRGAVIVSGTTLEHEPDIVDLEGLLAIDPARIMALEPEVLLLGTGERQAFPPASFNARFLSAGIGFEAMDTGAACRTYNVLVGEQRRVVAMLLAE